MTSTYDHPTQSLIESNQNCSLKDEADGRSHSASRPDSDGKPGREDELHHIFRSEGSTSLQSASKNAQAQQRLPRPVNFDVEKQPAAIIPTKRKGNAGISAREPIQLDDENKPYDFTSSGEDNVRPEKSSNMPHRVSKMTPA